MEKVKRTHLLSKGFTLPDVILIMAILAVLMTSMYPMVSDYLAKSREQEEVARQAEIADAFEVYLRSVGEFPLSIDNAWNNVATLFASDTSITNLSEYEMREDAFEQNRTLLMDVNTVNFSGGSYDVHYIAIISLGDDGCYGDPSASCDAAPTSLADVDASAGFTLADYDALVADPNSDDVITKFTDAKIKSESYNNLLLQISSIEQALDQFSYQAKKQAESRIEDGCRALVSLSYSMYNCYDDIRNNNLPGSNVAPRMPDEQIFLPLASSSAPVVSDFDDYDVNFPFFGRYTVMATVSATTPIYGSAVSYISNNAGTTQADLRDRKNAMKSLMFLLGLPERYCCNPLDKYFDHTTEKWESTPLFYNSDPRRISVAP